MHKLVVQAQACRTGHPTAKSILLYLADSYNPQTGCFPSQGKIAEVLELSTRTVIRHLESLEANRFLAREVIRKQGKVWGTKYILLPDNLSPDNLSPDNLSPDNLSISTCQPVRYYNKEVNRNITVNKKEEEYVYLIFQNWTQVLKHDKAKCDKKRKKYIADRLAEGFTVEELKLVPLGVLRSPYHLGDNPTKTKYDGVETVYRDAGQVEKFMALAHTQILETYDGCDICRNHPNRSILTTKKPGMILDLELGKTYPCECRIKLNGAT